MLNSNIPISAQSLVERFYNNEICYDDFCEALALMALNLEAVDCRLEARKVDAIFNSIVFGF